MKVALGKRVKRANERQITLQESQLILQWFADQKDERYWTLFVVHCTLNLRICETISIQLSDFTKDMSQLNVRLAKTDIIKVKKIPIQLRNILFSYIERHMHQIMLCNKYLFYSVNSNNKTGHIGRIKAYYRLRDAVRGCGIDDRISDMRLDGKPQYRIGTHSFRRFTTTELLRVTGGNIPFVAFSRGDTDFRQTATYANRNMYAMMEEKETKKILQLLFQKPEEPSVTLNQEYIADLVKAELERRLRMLFTEQPSVIPMVDSIAHKKTP